MNARQGSQEFAADERIEVSPRKLTFGLEPLQFVAAVEQARDLTRFAFGPGCYLRVQILQAKTDRTTKAGRQS